MENQNSLRDDEYPLPRRVCPSCKNQDEPWQVGWQDGRCPACGERDDRIFPDQYHRALAAAYLVHASEHEWPTGEDLRLVCLALILSHERSAQMRVLLERCAGGISNGVRSAADRRALYEEIRAMLDSYEGFRQ